MTTVIGYAYKADIYCVWCVVARVRKDNKLVSNKRVASFYPELILDHAARLLNIDRTDERTYDSGVFPKVEYEDHEYTQHCTACGALLGGK